MLSPFLIMSFQPLIDFLEKFAKFDLDKAIQEISNTQEFKNEVVRLNTREQLFKEGINSEGRLLEDIGGEYSPFTKREKLRKTPPQPVDRVTLNDTGEFYDSFKVIVFRGGFEITADPIKESGSLFVEWGPEIVGLTMESKEIVGEIYREALIKDLEKRFR